MPDDQRRRIAQLVAHSIGTVLLLVAVGGTYFLGFSKPRLGVFFTFAAIELVVLLLSLAAAMRVFGVGARSLTSSFRTALGEEPIALDVNVDPGRSVDILLASTTALTAVSLTWLTAFTGGVSASPFGQLLLIAIIFGQATARNEPSLWKTMVLGLVGFLALLFLDWRSEVGPPGEISSLAYFGLAIVGLVFSTVLNRVAHRAIRARRSADEN